MGYPPGAQNDPRAPYNEPESTQSLCEGCHVWTDNDVLEEFENKWLCPDCINDAINEANEKDD